MATTQWGDTGAPIEYVTDTTTRTMTWDHTLFRYTPFEQRQWIMDARHTVVGEPAIRSLARHIATEFDVPMPKLLLHARRRICNGRYLSPGFDHRHGAVRLGRYATVEIIAHEMAHHVVAWAHPHGTAAHGRVWAETTGDGIELVAHDFAWVPMQLTRIATIRRVSPGQ